MTKCPEIWNSDIAMVILLVTPTNPTMVIFQGYRSDKPSSQHFWHFPWHFGQSHPSWELTTSHHCHCHCQRQRQDYSTILWWIAFSHNSFKETSKPLLPFSLLKFFALMKTTGQRSAQLCAICTDFQTYLLLLNPTESTSSSTDGQNAVFAVHQDFKSHTGAIMSVGKWATLDISRRQKNNIKISTKAKLVNVYDFITKMIYSSWHRGICNTSQYFIRISDIFDQGCRCQYLGKSRKDCAFWFSCERYFLRWNSLESVSFDILPLDLWHLIL